MKVGIFDDTKDIRVLIEDFLKDEGHEIISSVGRPQDLMNLEECEVLIMDVRSNEDRYAGINFIVSKHSEGQIQSAKVIFISQFGRGNPEIKRLLERVGFYEWLDKPIEFAELLKILIRISKSKESK